VNRAPVSDVTPAHVVELNGTLFFAHSDGVHGTELWKSDGTPGGTEMVKDIRAGRGSSNPAALAVFNGMVYFTASDEQSNTDQIWRSNGTAPGTVRVADLVPGMSTGPAFDLTAVGSTLFFFANHTGGSDGYSIWKTDGTTAGTVMLKGVRSTVGSYPSNPVVLGDRLYFIVGGSTAGGELWSSDGTTAGTGQLNLFNDYPVANLTRVGQSLYFSTGGGRLWRWSSTGGLGLIATIAGGGTAAALANFRAVGERLFFTANDGVNGNELWSTSGGGGTAMVKDIAPGSAGSTPQSLAALNGRVYFSATNSTSGRELWSSDGTAAGTTIVKDIRAGLSSSSPANLAAVGGALYFAAAGSDAASAGLWVSDGSTAGTRLVHSFGGYNAHKPEPLFALGPVVYLRANDGVAGHELWRTDASSGSAGGTQLVKDVYPATGAALTQFMKVLGGRLYFFADDGVHGHEPWYTDGTPAGTGLLKDIDPLDGSRTNDWGGDGIVAGPYLYFNAHDGSTADAQLWRTDGTEAGTIKVKSLGYNITSWGVIGDTLYFTTSGLDLWRSDGTPDGTVRVSAVWNRFGIDTVVDGIMYGTGFDAASGRELWRSDGTLAGTYRVADLNPGEAYSNPVALRAVGDMLFFFADDGTPGGNKLFTYTPADGIRLVKDCAPGNDHTGSNGIVVSGNRLFFGAPHLGWSEPWVSDGTPAGTYQIADLNPGTQQASNPEQMYDLNGIVYFKATGAAGTGLYRTDGTAAGTYKAADLVPQHTGTAFRSGFVGVGDQLLFTALHQGYEGVWRTDGTPAGTWLASSVDAGGIHYTSQFAVLGSSVIFNGDDRIKGQEIWRLTLDEPPLRVVTPAFSPSGGPGSRLDFSLNRAPVDGSWPADMSVRNLTTDALVPASYVRPTFHGSTSSVVYTFPGYPGGILPDGNYRASLPAGSLGDAAGNPLARDYTFDFFVLGGDANRDRTVNLRDFNILASNFGRTDATFAHGDFNDDGTVNLSDFNILAGRFGTVLAPPAGGIASPEDPLDDDEDGEDEALSELG
jgi:ELWxxDGT repeat protein